MSNVDFYNRTSIGTWYTDLNRGTNYSNSNEQTIKNVEVDVIYCNKIFNRYLLIWVWSECKVLSFDKINKATSNIVFRLSRVETNF